MRDNVNEIYDSQIVCASKVCNPRYDRIMCSISGGSDSDILIDLVESCNPIKPINYVFFDTGFEYSATKKHLCYLEDRYGVRIQRVPAVLPIPLACKKYGVPFLSKQISEFIMRLQKHGFDWVDDSYDNLIERFPKCQAALKWWCNKWEDTKKGKPSKFNINYRKGLKEFLMIYPPEIPISYQCCKWSKKLPAVRYKRDNRIQLSIMGVRKAEGGARSSAYSNCFTPDYYGVDEYRPLFWYKKEDKENYVTTRNIVNSDCYCVYGLERTGCCGCPLNPDWIHEIAIIKKYEPKFYAAIYAVFGKVYEYTLKYREFVRGVFNE